VLGPDGLENRPTQDSSSPESLATPSLTGRGLWRLAPLEGATLDRPLIPGRRALSHQIARRSLRAARAGAGQGNTALEVVICTSARPPQLPRLRTAWKDRNGGRPAPCCSSSCTTAGRPSADRPAATRRHAPDLDCGLTERLCRDALEQPDRHAAARFLRDARAPLRGTRSGAGQ
jgi:hypothetical protein